MSEATHLPHRLLHETASPYLLATFAQSGVGETTVLKGFEITATRAGDVGQQRANRECHLQDQLFTETEVKLSNAQFL